MTARDVARAQAAARVAVGAVLVAAPELVGVPWIGRDARRPASHVYSAGLGVRDAALGAGAGRHDPGPDLAGRAAIWRAASALYLVAPPPPPASGASVSR